MIFLFKLALLAALVAVALRTTIHSGVLACLYLIGWMTPWIIPQALAGEFRWALLLIPTAIFLTTWLMLWVVRYLNGKPLQLPCAAVGCLLIAALS